MDTPPRRGKIRKVDTKISESPRLRASHPHPHPHRPAGASASSPAEEEATGGTHAVRRITYNARTAAVKIQASYRGFSARSQYKPSPASAAEAAPATGTTESTAASVIQAAYRGSRQRLAVHAPNDPSSGVGRYFWAVTSHPIRRPTSFPPQTHMYPQSAGCGAPRLTHPTYACPLGVRQSIRAHPHQVGR